MSDKLKSSEKITLVHEDQIIINDDENTKILNAVQHLKILESGNIDFSAECLSRPALKAILKFRNHPSVRNAFLLLETHLIHKASVC